MKKKGNIMDRTDAYARPTHRAPYRRQVRMGLARQPPA